MSCDLDTKFVKVDHVGENLLINQMESTLKTYLDWGLLSVGGWTNIETPAPQEAASATPSKNLKLLYKNMVFLLIETVF